MMLFNYALHDVRLFVKLIRRLPLAQLQYFVENDNRDSAS